MLRCLDSSESIRESWKVSEQGITLYNLCCRKPTLSKCDGLNRKGKLDAEENHTWSKPQMVSSGHRDRWGLWGLKATVPWLNVRLGLWVISYAFHLEPKVIHLHEASDHSWLLSPENKFLRSETLYAKVQNTEAAPENLFPPLMNHNGNWSLNLVTYREQQIFYTNNISLASCVKKKC